MSEKKPSTMIDDLAHFKDPGLHAHTKETHRDGIEDINTVIGYIVNCTNDVTSIRNLDKKLYQFESHVLAAHTDNIHFSHQVIKPVIDRAAVSREINLPGIEGNTILHVLAQKMTELSPESKERIYLAGTIGDLIRGYGADVLVENDEGKTAIDYCQELQELAVFSLKEAQGEIADRIESLNSQENAFLPEDAKRILLAKEKDLLAKLQFKTALVAKTKEGDADREGRGTYTPTVDKK